MGCHAEMLVTVFGNRKCTGNARAGTDCGRSLADIAEWGGASADRQRVILAALPKRMAQLAAGLPLIP